MDPGLRRDDGHCLIENVFFQSCLFAINETFKTDYMKFSIQAVDSLSRS